MTPKGKKVLIVSVALLVIGGVVAYLLINKNKEKKAKAKADADAKALADASQQGGGAGTSGGGASGGGASDKPSDVKAFQDWMDKNHPNWVNGNNLNGGSGYGTFGPATQSAWGNWKAEYNKASSPVSDPDKAYQDAWASARKANSPTFVFNGKAYDTTTGRVYVDPSLIGIGDTLYATSKVSGYTGAGLITQFSSGGSMFGNFYQNEVVGVVTGVDNIHASFQVQNLKSPMKSSSGNFATIFYVPQNLVTKVKPVYPQ
jgi:hypothetical protein